MAELSEELLKVFLTQLRVDVLDIKISELGFHLVELRLTFLRIKVNAQAFMKRGTPHLARDMEADVDLLVVEQHTVDRLYGVISSLRSLVVDETISLRTAVLVCGDLARQDIAKGGKSVMESLSISLAGNTCFIFELGTPCCR
jgi:hypothetical protein